ncbi:hypothetical protein [uncultured Veillonella sp.]
MISFGMLVATIIMAAK